MKLVAHEATTAQLGALYPFVASRPLPTDLVLVGRDLCGGPFAHDPFELYRRGALTNPNVLVLGQIGRGKSAFVKTYLYRQAAFGRRLVVLDPKGEYGPLARALGSEPLRLSPGGTLRLNPLEAAARGGPDTGRAAALGALCSVAAACLRRPLAPAEATALELALADAEAHGRATLPAVVAALLSPLEVAAREIGASRALLAADGREVALELRRFVHGEFAGMFDGPTSPGVDLAARVLVVDLSAVYHSGALGAVVACAGAALESAYRHGEGQTVLVVDEAWAVLSNLGTARFLQASLKLARAFGLANLVVAHRLSDLRAAGDADSVTARIAEGLLADCETVVCYAQSPTEVPAVVAALGLSPTEAALVPRLRRGVALWRVGSRSFLVEHRLAAAERPLVDTDARLRGPAGEAGEETGELSGAPA